MKILPKQSTKAITSIHAKKKKGSVKTKNSTHRCNEDGKR
jgi:hypothetical protein